MKVVGRDRGYYVDWSMLQRQVMWVGQLSRCVSTKSPRVL